MPHRYLNKADFLGDVMIRDIKELASYIGAHNAVGCVMSRRLYKDTACGAWLEIGEGAASVKLGSIVEGTDRSATTRVLTFPFEASEYDAAVKAIEAEVDEIWRDLQDSTDDDVGWGLFRDSDSKDSYQNAYQWGVANGCCEEELEWWRSLGHATSPAVVWRICRRGDWMLRALSGFRVRRHVYKQILKAVDVVVARAIRRGVVSLRGIREPWATSWRRWANEWLSGVDRSCGAAEGEIQGIRRAMRVADTAAWGAARVAVLATEAALLHAAVSAVEGPVMWTISSTAARVAEISKASFLLTGGMAQAAEYALQAKDIRGFVPEWPGIGR